MKIPNQFMLGFRQNKLTLFCFVSPEEIKYYARMWEGFSDESIQSILHTDVKDLKSIVVKTLNFKEVENLDPYDTKNLSHYDEILEIHSNGSDVIELIVKIKFRFTFYRKG